jgi:hypothetical protein
MERLEARASLSVLTNIKSSAPSWLLQATFCSHCPQHGRRIQPSVAVAKPPVQVWARAVTGQTHMADRLSRSQTLTPTKEDGSTAVMIPVDPACEMAVQMLVGTRSDQETVSTP